MDRYWCRRMLVGIVVDRNNTVKGIVESNHFSQRGEPKCSPNDDWIALFIKMPKCLTGLLCYNGIDLHLICLFLRLLLLAVEWWIQYSTMTKMATDVDRVSNNQHRRARGSFKRWFAATSTQMKIDAWCLFRRRGMEISNILRKPSKIVVRRRPAAWHDVIADSWVVLLTVSVCPPIRMLSLALFFAPHKRSSSLFSHRDNTAQQRLQYITDIDICTGTTDLTRN